MTQPNPFDLFPWLVVIGACSLCLPGVWLLRFLSDGPVEDEQ
jgi:hypothetical protein